MHPSYHAQVTCMQCKPGYEADSNFKVRRQG